MSYLVEYVLCTRQNFYSNFAYQNIQLCTTLRAAMLAQIYTYYMKMEIRLVHLKFSMGYR